LKNAPHQSPASNHAAHSICDRSLDFKHIDRDRFFIRYAGALVWIRGRLTDANCHREIHRRSLIGQPINLADPAEPPFGPKRAYSPPQLCWQISGWSAGNWYTNIWRDAAAPRKRGGLEFNCGRGVPPSSQSRKALRPQGPGVQPRRGLPFVRLFERDGNLPGTVCPALLPIRHNPPKRHKAVSPRELRSCQLGGLGTGDT
jgi:hypothetical protein